MVYRMVGGPAQGYHQTPLQRPQDCFEYFRPFEPFEYSESMEMQELPAPSSPNSVQSDSDTSISSVEVPSQTIRCLKGSPEVESQCRWRSCGLRFPSLDQLANHVAKVHSASGRGGLFYCGWEGCTRNDKGFNARYKMLVHVRTHTNEKPHKCFQCEKSFSRAENLKIHSRSHSGEKPYICPVPGCNKAYSNSSDRFKHTRTHQVEKPYQCKVPGCPKRYTDPSSLRKHVKTYKHFVNDQKSSDSIQVTSEPQQTLREDIIKHPCSCNRMCCLTNCISNPARADYNNSAPDFFSISALINLKNEETRWGRYMTEKAVSSNWNGYMDPYFTENQGGSKWEGCTDSYITIDKKTTMYVDCDVRQEVTDVDAPLDLSVHRKD